MNICMEMSTQGFFAVIWFSGMDIHYWFCCVRSAFKVHLKVSAKVHKIHFIWSVSPSMLNGQSQDLLPRCNSRMPM